MKKSKWLGLALVSAMTAGLASCGGGEGGNIAELQAQIDALTQQVQQLQGNLDTIKEVYGIDLAKKIPEIKTAYDYVETEGLEGIDLENALIYNKTFGTFAKQYEEAGNAETLSEKYVYEALAEAKLLESGAFLPGECNGGNYAMGRNVYKSVPTVSWGTDEYRLKSKIVTDQIVTAEDWAALKALWVEKKGSGEYLAAARAYLAGKGYTFPKQDTVFYTGDPASWDVLSDYMAVTAEALVNTYDGLVQYNVEDEVVPAMAESWEWGTNAAGEMTITFTIRPGNKWYTSDRTEIGDVTAEDFVAGFRHMLDCEEHGWYVYGLIKGAEEYDGTNFADVGVKAEGNKLTYTFEEGTEYAKDYFLTMLEYSPFAPLCSTYYIAQGGTFGENHTNGNYAKDYTHIAYSGAYFISNYTEKNTVVFEKNANYWDAANVNLDKITWIFNDGSDPLQAYNAFKAGTVSSTGLNSTTLQLAKDEGYFDQYARVSGLDCGSYPFWFAGNRKVFSSTNTQFPLDSQKTAEEKVAGQKALANTYFRLALCCSIDRVAYQTALLGDAAIAPNALLNSYTPGHFVHTTEDVTVEINGVPHTFTAGASYGEIMQAQIEADGYPFVVWRADPTAEDGRGTGAGYDGWYNPEWANAFLLKAVEELKAEGLTITKEHPVVLELPYISTNSSNTAGNAAVKESIEKATNGLVEVRLLPAASAYNLYYAAYYNESGADLNVDISKISGWGPDYGDPKTFLDTFLPAYDGMAKNFGIY